jgi:hypothetical protein
MGKCMDEWANYTEGKALISDRGENGVTWSMMNDNYDNDSNFGADNIYFLLFEMMIMKGGAMILSTNK